MALQLAVDTYIDLADANEYLATYSDGTEVVEADLQRATLAVDRLYGARFIGSPTDPAQPLAFPRSGATELPVSLSHATAELAALMSKRLDPYAQPPPGVLEYSSKIDVLEEKFKYATATSANALHRIELILASLLRSTSVGGTQWMDLVLS